MTCPLWALWARITSFRPGSGSPENYQDSRPPVQGANISSDETNHLGIECPLAPPTHECPKNFEMFPKTSSVEKTGLWQT